MTANEFRKLALSFPEAIEAMHMNHPDFRVGGKIFATIWPDDNWGMVKLIIEQQASFVNAEPKVFEPIKGYWGKKGATRINLRTAKKGSVMRALEMAWRNTAPRRVVREFDEG
jgi:hypothetical protein